MTLPRFAPRFASIVSLAGPVFTLIVLPGCGVSDAGGQFDREAPPANSAGNATHPATLSAKAAPQVTDWPCWRGPGEQGIAAPDALPRSLPEKPRSLWKQPLGTGWSSPVVAGKRVFVTDRKENTERLLAFDADSGKPLWAVTNPVDFDPHAVGRRHGNGPKSTPAVDAKCVYSLGIAGWLQAVDACTGSVIWKVNLPERFGERTPLPDGRAYVEGTEHVIVPVGKGEGAPVPLFGYTGSILLADGLVIVSVGGAKGGTIMAFDARDGRVVWSSLDEHVSYSSPIVVELARIKQVVVMTGPRVVGLQLTDGKLLWSHPFQIQYDESISTPTVFGQVVLVTGDSHPLTALSIPDKLSADQPADVQPAWESWALSSYLSSMVVADGHVYGMGDDGQFVCVSLDDGQTVWSGGNHGTYCSPILCGNRLLGLNEEGELAVLEATPKAYRQLALIQVADEQTWTVPAVVAGRVYVRSKSDLTAFDFSR